MSRTGLGTVWRGTAGRRDQGRRRSMALRDQADVALLEGDALEPHEGC